MSDYKVYALRAGDYDRSEYSPQTLFKHIQAGEGRFGWGYVETADLNQLRKRIDDPGKGWCSLSEQEKDCWQWFLLQLKKGDWVVYINLPEYGKCTTACVSGGYRWQWDGERTDFNHRIQLDKSTVRTFETNDASVHPYLRARLKLPGRKWQIYCVDKFAELLQSIEEGKTGKHHYDGSTDLAYLGKEIEPFLADVTKHIHKTHPNYSLEGLIGAVFKNIPGVVDVKVLGGAGDHGADIIVEYEEGLPFFRSQKKCVVQVKSYEEKHWDTTAVSDIERALPYFNADMGLVVSTASESTGPVDAGLERLRTLFGKPIELMIGKDVARFVLQYGMDLIP